MNGEESLMVLHPILTPGHFLYDYFSPISENLKDSFVVELFSGKQVLTIKHGLMFNSLVIVGLSQQLTAVGES